MSKKRQIIAAHLRPTRGPKRPSMYKVAGEAQQSGFKEGLRARREGKPRTSPYVDGAGEPYVAFRTIHKGWLMGWDAGQ